MGKVLSLIRKEETTERLEFDEKLDERITIPVGSRTKDVLRNMARARGMDLATFCRRNIFDHIGLKPFLGDLRDKLNQIIT